MKYILITICLILFYCYAIAQAGSKEKLLNQLESTGVLNRAGSNTLEFNVEKLSDSILVKKKYEQLFKKDDGSFYQVRYTTGNIEKTKEIPVAANKTNAVRQNNTITTMQPVADGCFSIIKAFYYIGVSTASTRGSAFSEYTWTVPAGVTKIKVEGWSAGGDGGNKSLRGGGGGGGAFVTGFIKVSSGMKLKIRIPGGGSTHPLIVRSETDGIGYLGVESGQNAQKETDTQFQGKGGRLLQSTGIFNGNILCFNGEDGLLSYRLNFNKGGSIAQMVFWGNDGGSSPKGGFGGAGAIYNDIELNYSRIARDGTFPGGGGGGGDLYFPKPEENKSGRGASGLLVIYY
jgi:hypothetical protein